MKARPDSGIDREWHHALADAMAERARQLQAMRTTGRELDEKVHDTRTTIKRLRALWRLARPSVSEALFQRENRRLRGAMHRLEGMRNRRVIQATLRRIPELARNVSAAATARLERQLAPPTGDAVAIRNVRSALPGVLREIDRSIRAFRALELEGRGWIRVGLRRSFRRARTASRLEPDSADEAFHLWRRRVKTLFYHLEALEPLGARRISRLRGGLDDLQERLGEDHDFVMLIEAIDKRAGRADADAAHAVKAAARRRVRTLRRKALGSRKKLLGKKAEEAVNEMAKRR
jgi:CHAD domain-containing protein